MPLIKTIRPSDSPHLLCVTHYTADADVVELATPDGSWGLVVIRREGTSLTLLTGQTTKAVDLQLGPGDEILSVSFKASSYLNYVAAQEIVDQGRLLGVPGESHFRLVSDVLEIPTFENAEGLVDRLIRNGLLAQDEIVDGLLYGQERAASARSVQRHFLHATGLTQKDFQQIERANRAVVFLSTGMAAVDVAFELGYADQAHLTRSLKRFTNRTPSEIQRA